MGFNAVTAPGLWCATVNWAWNTTPSAGTWVSTDRGSTWSWTRDDSLDRYSGLMYAGTSPTSAGGNFVAHTENTAGLGRHVKYSADGATWAHTTTPYPASLTPGLVLFGSGALVTGTGRMVIWLRAGFTAGFAIVYSDDGGVTWAEGPASAWSPQNQVPYNTTLGAVVAYSGQVYTSTDGLTWAAACTTAAYGTETGHGP
jgi:hypothetical protein